MNILMPVDSRLLHRTKVPHQSGSLNVVGLLAFTWTQVSQQLINGSQKTYKNLHPEETFQVI